MVATPGYHFSRVTLWRAAADDLVVVKEQSPSTGPSRSSQGHDRLPLYAVAWWLQWGVMSAPRSDLTSPPPTAQARWKRISESEARAAAGDDAIDEAVAEVGAKGRASADRYRADGHMIADQA